MGKQRISEGNAGRAANQARMETPMPVAIAIPALRAAVRFPIRLGIRILTGNGEIHAETEDISSNGLLFISDWLPELDSRVEFTIAMPSAVMGSQTDVSVHCIGRVVRHQHTGSAKKTAVVIDEYFLKA